MAKKKKATSQDAPTTTDENVDVTPNQTANLFPELKDDDGYKLLEDERKPSAAESEAIAHPDAPEVEDEKAEENKPEEPKPEQNDETTSTNLPAEGETTKTEEPEFIDYEAIKDKKLKRKVDGEEVEQSLSEWLKISGLERTLTKRYQKLAEERRSFAEERQKALSQGQPQFNQNPVTKQDAEPEYESDETKALKREIEDIRAQMSQLRNDPGLAEVQVQGNVNRLSKELEVDGFNDFKDYLPKMDDYVSQLKDDKQVLYYNTDHGAKELYFKLKATDLKETKQQVAAQNNNTTGRPKPPIVKVASGTSRVEGENDDKQAQYKELFSKARKSKNEEDILEVMKMSKWE